MIRSFAQHKAVNEQTRSTNQGYPPSLLTKTIVSLGNCSIYYRVNHRHNRHCRSPDLRVVNSGGGFCLTKRENQMKEIIYASAQPTEMVRVNTLACLEALLNILVNSAELAMIAIGCLIILTVIYKKNKIRSIAKNFRLTSDAGKFNIKDKLAILCGGCLMTSGPALTFCCNWLVRLYADNLM